jgi:hypothetical protein
LVAAWKDSTADERTRIVTSILSVIEVKDRMIESFDVRLGWRPYFEELAESDVRGKRETGLRPAEEPMIAGVTRLLGVVLLVAAG